MKNLNLKDLLDEAMSRGDKIKDEVLNDLMKSKAVHQLVGNKHFIKALSQVLQTKDELQKTLNKQVHGVLKLMEIPTKKEINRLSREIASLEKKLAKKKAASKTKTTKKKTSKKKTTTKKKTVKKKAAKKKTATKKKAAPKKKTKKKTTRRR